MGAMYTRWLDQYQDDQTSAGASNNFVPSLGSGAGAPNWQSAYPSIVWALYMYNGDITPAERHHDSLVAYYDNLERQYEQRGPNPRALLIPRALPAGPKMVSSRLAAGTTRVRASRRTRRDSVTSSSEEPAFAHVSSE